MENYITISFVDDKVKTRHKIHKDIIGHIIAKEDSSKNSYQVKIISKTGEEIIDRIFKDPYQFDNFVENIDHQLKEV